MRPSGKREIRKTVRARCDEDGIEEVRNKLARSAYNGQKRSMAVEWLKEQVEAEREKKETAEREIDRQIARGANRRATIANVISIVALVVAAVALLAE